ncbi:MAG: hypothetical protein H7Y07_01845 [Pyrinomonadaceae bacterium]|nr:hypothetical protein [Sphingobacteriaceae bacterium]
MSKVWIYFLFTILSSLVSCKEIIEPSIANKNVVLLAPSNNVESIQYNLSFWIEPLDDALFYRLQIVAPQFDSINKLIVDTLINSNKFSLNIDPGNYQWRVRAENGSSKTSFSDPRSFTILLSSITAQKIRLISPSTNFIATQSPISFKWERIFGAGNYRLQIDTANFIDESKLYYNQVTPNIQAALSFSTDKSYQWRVRAETTTEQSQWSEVNLFIYDHTPPSKVVLISPQKDQQIILPVILQWNAVASARKYKLFVFKSDATTPYDNTFPVLLTTTSYSFNKGSINETIYWKVSAIDEAGNEGESSELRDFVIQ